MLAIEVPEHEHKEIAGLVMAVERLAESQKELTTDMKTVAKSMGQLEIVLERIGNIKTQTDESITRLHKRIDDVSSDVNKVKNTCDNEGCKALQLAIANHSTKEAKQNATVEIIAKHIEGDKQFRGRVIWAITALLITAVANLILK